MAERSVINCIRGAVRGRVLFSDERQKQPTVKRWKLTKPRAKRRKNVHTYFHLRIHVRTRTHVYTRQTVQREREREREKGRKSDDDKNEKGTREIRAKRKAENERFNQDWVARQKLAFAGRGEGVQARLNAWYYVGWWMPLVNFIISWVDALSAGRFRWKSRKDEIKNRERERGEIAKSRRRTEGGKSGRKRGRKSESKSGQIVWGRSWPSRTRSDVDVKFFANEERDEEEKNYKSEEEGKTRRKKGGKREREEKGRWRKSEDDWPLGPPSWRWVLI